MRTFVGSNDAFITWWSAQSVAPHDVAILTSAAAFAGPLPAAAVVQHIIGGGNVVNVVDRAGATDETNTASLRVARLVVCLDGSGLHARTLWRHSAVGEAVGEATVVAIGSVGSVLGETMIDPRGGAPTTGMGLFRGVAITTMGEAEQRRRTYELLGDTVTLIELGRSGVVTEHDDSWRVEQGDVLVTRAGVAVGL